MSIFSSFLETVCCTSSTPRWFILLKCLLLIIFIVYVSTVTGMFIKHFSKYSFESNLSLKVYTWHMEIAVEMRLQVLEQILQFHLVQQALYHQYLLVPQLEVSSIYR